jgi:hypothetical protein
MNRLRTLHPLMMPKPWTFRSLLCLLLVSVTARGHVIYNKPEPTLQRRQSNPSVVTGITWRDENGMHIQRMQWALL